MAQNLAVSGIPGDRLSGGGFLAPGFGASVVPTFIAETSATESLTANSLTITPANVSGNLLVLGIAARGSLALQSVTSVTDTSGNTWRQAPGAAATNGNLDVEVWYCLTTAIAGTVTVNLSGLCSTVLSCVEYSNADTVDVIKAASGSSTSPATGTSATTDVSNEIAFAFVGSTDTTAFSAQTSGYYSNAQHTSTIAALNCTAQSSFQTLWADGTQSFGLTAGNAPWGAILVTVSQEVLLAANGVSTTVGTASVVATDALTANGVAVTVGTASMIATDVLGANGVASTVGSAAMITTDVLGANGVASTSGTASVITTDILSANGIASTAGTASLVATDVLAANGVSTTTGAADWAALLVSANGAATTAGTASLIAGMVLGASGVATTTGTASLIATDVLGANGAATTSGSAVFGVILLSANGAATTVGSADLTATLLLGANGASHSIGGASFTPYALAANGAAHTIGTALLNLAIQQRGHAVMTLSLATQGAMTSSLGSRGAMTATLVTSGDVTLAV